MFTLIKVVVSALLIGFITWLARLFPTYGGYIAALPLVSLLSLVWLYVQGETHNELSQFITSVLLGFPATALMLFIVLQLIKSSTPIFVCLLVGIAGWAVWLGIQTFVLNKFI
ncbi:DUF3147 family protein [Pseudalkalibacillus decolorationis]|uniref:DUF3147 family protein n=1 Tax=Pseudalkalibacillus decolorationis TaxID=163879 RepID=UPI00214837AA|nr:DUF3147 family protein [Pseudalkalibacillus decolorationis]